MRFIPPLRERYNTTSHDVPNAPSPRQHSLPRGLRFLFVYLHRSAADQRISRIQNHRVIGADARYDFDLSAVVAAYRYGNQLGAAFSHDRDSKPFGAE